jgi:hypothetical protein
LDQIFDSPVDANACEKGSESKEDQKYQWLLKEEAVIEDTSQFLEPLDIDSESKEKSHQDYHRNQIEEKKVPSSCPSALSSEGKEKREMKKEQRSKDDSYKDHLHPKDGIDEIIAIDHDELAHIPSGKGKNEACEEAVG